MTKLLGARRLGALAGVVFVVLVIGGGVVHGSPPSATATAAKVTGFYREHHSSVLVSLLLAAVGFVVLIVWASALASELRAASRYVAAGTLLASITGAAAVSVLSGGVEVGVAQAAVRSVDPEFIRGAYIVATALYPIPYFFVALAAAAVVLGGSGVLPAWFTWLSGVVGVLNVLGGISVRASGFFATNDGGAIVFAGLALAVWVLAASWILWRRPAADVIAHASL